MADNNFDVPVAPEGLRLVFPYLVVLAAYFVTGVTFLLVDLPMLSAFFDGNAFPSAAQAIDVPFHYWRRHIHHDSGATVFLLFCVMALTCGVLVQRLAIFLVAAIALVLQRVPSCPAFYQHSLQRKDNPQLLDWLQENRVAKDVWEWEFFQYYLFAGLFANAAVASFTIIWTWPPRAWHLWPVVLVAFAAVQALAQSAVLQRTYEYYRGRLAAAIPRSEGASSLA